MVRSDEARQGMRTKSIEQCLLREPSEQHAAKGAWRESKATSGLCQPLIVAIPPHAT